MTQAAETPRHWLRGGSTAPRAMACPGVYHEVAKYPADPSGSAAIDGTHTHTLVEHCLRNKISPTLTVGQAFGDHDGEFVVDPERAKRAQVAWDFVGGIIARNSHDPLDMHLETFVDAGGPHNIPEWGGAADIILASHNSFTPWVHVIDYKDGFHPVPADSPQLITYALGAINEFFHKPQRPLPHTVTLSIVQPKRPEPIDSRLYTWSQFLALANPVIDAMRATLPPDAPQVPGEHCKYCRAALPGRCKAYGDSMTVNLHNAFGAVVSPPGDSASCPDTEDPIAMDTRLTAAPAALPFQLPDISDATSNEQLASLLDVEDLVVELFKDVRKEALRRAQQGQHIPGHKVVRAPSQRKFVPGAEGEFHKMRLKKDVYLVEKLKTPRQLLESEEFKSLSKARQAKIQTLVIKPEGALRIVPETHDGQPVVFSAQKLFADVPPPPPPAM